MRVHVWGLIVTLAMAGGCKPSEVAPPGAEAIGSSGSPTEEPLNTDPRARVGPFVVDLDLDGVPDTMTLIAFPDSEMPPVFQALELHLSASGIDTTIRGYWDRPGQAHFQGGQNLIADDACFVARGRGDRSFLFLFGQDGVMPAQELEIFAVSRAGIRKYYHSGGFTFTEPLERDHGPVIGFRGVVGWGEGLISPNGDTLGGGSYSPTIAFRLTDSITIDSATSQALTRKALGGFAGYEESGDIVVLMKDSSRFVISSKDHRRLP